LLKDNRHRRDLSPVIQIRSIVCFDVDADAPSNIGSPGVKRQKAKGKRQKAKMQNCALTIAQAFESDGMSILLPFGFCLLPFAFLSG
jgi:hypothetical protein